MHARYETLCDGKLPKGCRKRTTWDKLKALKNACHKVMVAKKEHFFLECSANPNGLTCRGCKTFSHDGMCPHVLAVTHVMEQLKDEGERDGSLDLHKVMCTLDRAGVEGDVGQVDEGVIKGRRKRRRWVKKRERGEQLKSNVGQDIVTSKRVKKTKGTLAVEEQQLEHNMPGVVTPAGIQDEGKPGKGAGARKQGQGPGAVTGAGAEGSGKQGKGTTSRRTAEGASTVRGVGGTTRKRSCVGASVGASSPRTRPNSMKRGRPQFGAIHRSQETKLDRVKRLADGSGEDYAGIANFMSMYMKEANMAGTTPGAWGEPWPPLVAQKPQSTTAPRI